MKRKVKLEDGYGFCRTCGKVRSQDRHEMAPLVPKGPVRCGKCGRVVVRSIPEELAKEVLVQ